MVKHGTLKKRRSGRKVTRKPQKHRAVRIANSVVNVDVKKAYDKNKTPSANLREFGLISDVNNLKGSVDSVIPLTKHAAFLGFGRIMKDEGDGMNSVDSNPKRRKISEFDIAYARSNILKHKTDYKAMERDIKCNDRQYTAKQMENLCKKYYDATSTSADANLS
mmetsp:Transcript_4473/g.7315  ORF Transcript_4473/g.7315 Transcript_4473/m.7315 type:complete len:164 (-) Transcript_4473:77-568(-)